MIVDMNSNDQVLQELFVDNETKEFLKSKKFY